MSDAHNAAAQSATTNPITVAIWVAVGAVALVVGIILLAQVAVGTHPGAARPGDASMSPEAVAKRLGPVAKLVIDPNAPAAPAAAPVAPVEPAASAKSGAPDGKKAYESGCNACHGTGVAGAPKLGDKAAWESRLKAGKDALYASAVKGKGAMPPKAGQPALTEAEIKAGVEFMIATVK